MADQDLHLRHAESGLIEAIINRVPTQVNGLIGRINWRQRSDALILGRLTAVCSLLSLVSRPKTEELLVDNLTMSFGASLEPPPPHNSR